MKNEEEKNDKQKMLKVLESKIAKLEAKDEANAELRRLTNEKIDRLRENIGELKETIRDIQSERKEFEVGISKTQALVKSVQPEALRKDIRRLETVDSLTQGKMDMLQKKFNNFETRFQAFEEKLRLFKGHEELLELQNKVSKDLRNVEKTMHISEVHASKIENHFVKINERVNLAVSLIEEAREIEKHIESYKIDERIKELDNKMNMLDEILQNKQEDRIDDLAEVVSKVFHKVKENFLAINSRLEKISTRVQETKNPETNKSDKHLKDLAVAVSEAFKKVESDISMVNKRLSQLEVHLEKNTEEGQ